MGQFMGTRDSALLRTARLQGEADAETLQRLRPRRGRMPRGARKRGSSRYRAVLALRGHWTGGRALARLDDRRPASQARTGETCADAVGERQAQGRPDDHQLGRRDILDRRLLLFALLA